MKRKKLTVAEKKHRRKEVCARYNKEHADFIREIAKYRMRWYRSQCNEDAREAAIKKKEQGEEATRQRADARRSSRVLVKKLREAEKVEEEKAKVEAAERVEREAAKKVARARAHERRLLKIAEDRVSRSPSPDHVAGCVGRRDAMGVGYLRLSVDRTIGTVGGSRS